jgi:hypothetical protein
MGRMTEWMFWIGLALLFGAGLLFGLAVAQAEASEAWVAWGRTHFEFIGGTSRVTWEIMEAKPSAAECEAWISDRPREGTARIEPWTYFFNGSRVYGLHQDGSKATMLYYCLPATIDPRPQTGR